MKLTLQGLGEIESEDFLEEKSSGGVFYAGREGVKRVLSTYDKKVDFIQFEDKTLAHVHSSMGYPAIYSVNRPAYAGGALAGRYQCSQRGFLGLDYPADAGGADEESPL